MIFFLLACSGSATDSAPAGRHDQDTGSTDTGSADTGADSGDTGDTQDTAGGDLPDARAAMDGSGATCEVIAGHDDVPAAHQYYWGEFHGNSTEGWTGEEAWFLFGNTAWYARGLIDCEVRFTVTAEPGSKGKCASCDFGMTAHATVDMVATTCAPSQYAGYETMEEPYAVELLGDGSADWSFPASGTAFAHGYWTDTALNYLADDGCTLPVD